MKSPKKWMLPLSLERRIRPPPKTPPRNDEEKDEENTTEDSDPKGGGTGGDDSGDNGINPPVEDNPPEAATAAVATGGGDNGKYPVVPNKDVTSQNEQLKDYFPDPAAVANGDGSVLPGTSPKTAGSIPSEGGDLTNEGDVSGIKHRRAKGKKARKNDEVAGSDDEDDDSDDSDEDYDPKEHVPIYEWTAVNANTLLGFLADGKAVSLKVLKFYPFEGEVATSADGSTTYVLKAGKGAQLKKRKRAKKRKVNEASHSVSQMKDSKVRNKAKTVINHVKSLQVMTSYSSNKLSRNCPPSDFFLFNRDCIAVRPDEQQQGMQARKPHYSVLLPSDFEDSKEEVGKYFKIVGGLLAGDYADSKGRLLATTDIQEYYEWTYGQDVKKKGTKGDGDDDDDEDDDDDNMHAV